MPSLISVTSGQSFTWVSSGLLGAMGQNGKQISRGITTPDMKSMNIKCFLFAGELYLFLHQISMLLLKGRNNMEAGLRRKMEAGHEVYT